MAITYTSVRNPCWGDKQQTFINCEVNCDHVGFEEWSPCVVLGSGDEPYIHEIYNRCVAGDFGAIGDYVKPENIPQTTDDGRQPAIEFFIRERRNELLVECDKMMLVDRYNAMSAEKQQEWSTYRQALRDMPADSSYQSLEGVFNDDTREYEPSVTITWPTKPS